MFGLSNPLNAMQILFINILMDGKPIWQGLDGGGSYSATRTSQSEFGCRPGGPGGNATTAAKEGCTDHYEAVAVAGDVLGIDDRAGDAVCVRVWVIR